LTFEIGLEEQKSLLLGRLNIVQTCVYKFVKSQMLEEKL